MDGTTFILNFNRKSINQDLTIYSN